MNTTQLINTLRSGDATRIMAAAPAAADALELLEERLAIMGENLTDTEWSRNEREARQTIAKRGAEMQKDEIIKGQINIEDLFWSDDDLTPEPEEDEAPPWYGDTPEEQEAQRQAAEEVRKESERMREAARERARE